jgi:hypothetical protein
VASLVCLAFFTKWGLTRSFRIKRLGLIYKTRVALQSAHVLAIRIRAQFATLAGALSHSVGDIVPLAAV